MAKQNRIDPAIVRPSWDTMAISSVNLTCFLKLKILGTCIVLERQVKKQENRRQASSPVTQRQSPLLLRIPKQLSNSTCLTQKSNLTKCSVSTYLIFAPRQSIDKYIFNVKLKNHPVVPVAQMGPGLVFSVLPGVSQEIP